MSERYSRLFTLPENLYTVGSPVVIAAGTLLKDNQTGKVVAQLKLRSISDKVIKAVKVSLNLFDTAGNPIGNAVDYEYLDLDVSRDTEFGQKNPVLVAESKARSYEVTVTEVVFADKVYVMDDGKVVMEGTPKEIFSQVDALKALRLDVPQVTELAYELKKAGLDLPDGVLTIDEFIESMAAIKGR